MGTLIHSWLVRSTGGLGLAGGTEIRGQSCGVCTNSTQLVSESK